MSLSSPVYLNQISKGINLYLGPFFYAAGVLGNILCLLVFPSVKRLRTNPSSIYLLTTSVSNVILFNTSFLSRFVLPNFLSDPALTSLSWCKLRQYFGQSSSIVSLFCTAWAMIDQYYMAPSVNTRIRRFSSVKIARCVVFVTVLVSLLHCLPVLIYNEINVSNSTNITSCSLSTNPVYQNYVTYFVVPFLLGIIPAFIMVLVAILVYTNVNHLHQVRMRTQVQKQLTRMVSAQVVCVLLGTTIYTTYTIYGFVTASMSKSILELAQENFAFIFTGNFGYIGYSFNFYVYMVVSPSFRKQFKKFIKKYFNFLICYHQCTRSNQVAIVRVRVDVSTRGEPPRRVSA